MGNKVGRKSDLTPKVLAKIKESILSGKTLKETANLSGIELNTLYRWSCDNYANLSDKIEGWRRDYKLLKADRNIDKILDLDVNNKDFVKVVSDLSKFVKETLDKEYYGKNVDVTSGGEKIIPILGGKSNDISTNDISKQATETKEED